MRAPGLGLLPLLATPLMAQGVVGTVRGFTGEPAHLAVVRAFDTAGRRLSEVVTDHQGGFEIASETPIGLLELQNEGVSVQVPVKDGAPSVTVSFEKVPHFTLRGHVVDPAGQAMTAIDLLLRDENGRTIASVATDEKGAYRLRVDRTVAALVVDPLGLHHVHPCDVDRDGGVAVDLRLERDEFFSIEGRVLDASGSPVAGALVRGSSERTPLVQRRTKKDGSFVLWSARPVDYLMALSDGEPFALRFGVLDGDTSLELDPRRHGYADVTGRVVDAKGAPVPFVAVFAADARGVVVPGLPMLARSDAFGGFAARIPIDVPRVLAWQTKPQRMGMARYRAGEGLEIVLR